MLKRISKNQVRNGMFIEDFVGEWSNNPLSRRRFVIRDDAEIERLKLSTISGVIINTAMGLDVSAAGGDGVNIHAAAQARASAQAAAHDGGECRATVNSLKESAKALKDLFSVTQSEGKVSTEAVAPVADQITQSMQKNPLVLLNITRLKSKDETTFVHSIAVSALMVHLAQYMKMDDKTVQLLGMAGLLHDIGKMKIPDAVLNKTGKLTDQERMLIRDHPALGHKILSEHSDMPAAVLDICRHHHERLDGKGYPDGLSGSQISLFARLCTVCDVYDAITSIRPYKTPWTHKDAVTWMMAQQGAFDRELLHEFFSSMEHVMDVRKSA